MSAAGLRVVPEEPGGRAAHGLHQVQEAGGEPHDLQCGAGQGAPGPGGHPARGQQM